MEGIWVEIRKGIYRPGRSGKFDGGFGDTGGGTDGVEAVGHGWGEEEVREGDLCVGGGGGRGDYLRGVGVCGVLWVGHESGSVHSVGGYVA